MLLVEPSTFRDELVELRADSLLQRKISDELKIHDLQVRKIEEVRTLVVAYEQPSDSQLDFNKLTLSNFKADDWSYELHQLS
jgi:orotate phosphoribosyltransferase-like protein